MTFLNPMLLWGLGLAAVPIVIHLLNRRRYRRIRWAAMDFLLAALKKNQRRLRLENLLILIIRTLIVLLLALIVSRPFFTSSSALAALDRGRTSLVLILDNSYSMGLKTGLSTPFERALEQAAVLVGSLEREDTVTVILTADTKVRRDLQPRAVIQESADLDKVRSELGTYEPSPSASGLAPALRAAQDVLTRPAGSPRVVVLTDLQTLFWESGGEGLDVTSRDLLEQIRDRGIPVSVLDVGVNQPENVSVAEVSPEYRQAPVAGTDSTWKVVLQNHSPSPEQVELTLEMDGRKLESRSVEIGPSAGYGKPDEATETFRVVFTTPGSHTLRAAITTDVLPVDDRRTVAVRVRDRIRVLAVDGDPNPDDGKRPETFLLKNSLEILRSGPIQVDVVDALALAGTDLSPYDVVVLANVDRVREEVVANLERFVEDGRSLVFFLGDRVDPDLTNQLFLRTDDSLLPARLGRNEIRARDEAVKIDLEPSEHPMLADLTSPDNAGWFYSPPVFGFNRAVPVDSPKVRVLATYDDLERSPAIVERTMGKGHVVLFTTAADGDWADLGSAPLYVALLHNMVHHLTWRDPSLYNLEVGQTLDLTLPDGAERITVARPRGATLALDALREEGRVRAVLRDTDVPGEYTLTYRLPGGDPLAREEGEAVTVRYAFGLDPAEGDVTRLSRPALEARLRGLDVMLTRDPEQILARPMEARQGEIWRVLLVALIALLVLETFLARRFGDYSRREA